MNRLLISAAALALLSAPAAYAQQQQDQQDQHDHHQGSAGDRGQSGRHGSGGQQGGPSGASGQGGHQGGGQNSQTHSVQTGSSNQGVGHAQAGSHSGVAAIPDRRPASSQPGGRPDWDAYYRNNPDLQRAYKQNQQSPTYHESIEAFAQRHYEEHGKSEGRALPTVQGGSQAQGQQQGRWQGRGGAGARNWRSLQRNFTSPHRYRLPNYRWPRGMTYRRFVFGDFLPNLFIGRDYYIYDYAEYGLPYPPPGTVWVRYGPDALLVDRSSGEIIQVAYNIFYY